MKEKINLYFYEKLFQSNPMFEQSSASSKKQNFKFFTYFYKKTRNVLLAIFSIFRCLFLKKHKSLFFNHTERIRKNNGLFNSPLYLNENIFNPSFFYFVENNIKKHSQYKAPKAILDIAIINEFISLLTMPEKILNKFKKKPLNRQELVFLSHLKFWTMILKLLKPKKIFFVVWYAYQPVITAAKKLGIETIDLQHGVIYEEHKFYNIKKINLDFIDNYTLPDQFWVYGSYWKDQLIKAGWNEKKIKIFGYYLSIPAIKEKNEISFPYILYTTSCNANKQEVIDHINSIINKIKNRGLQIIISPHPHEDVENYQDILSDIVHLSNKDSYELLKNCEVHISAFSTLLWEGLYYNKSTYILSYDKYSSHFDLLSELINHDFARSILPEQFPEKFNLKDNLKFYSFFNEIEQNLLNIK